MDIRNTTFGILSAAAATTLVLAACAPDEENPGPGEEQDADSNGEAEFEETETTDDDGTMDDAEDADADTDGAANEANGNGEEQSDGDAPAYQAAEAIAEEYPAAVVSQFEVEQDEIEVDLLDPQANTELELEMDPETYEVTNEEQDDLDSDDLQKAEAVEIDFVDALRTAEDEGGAEPEDAELDDHNDTIVWEIELVDGTEVYVDVTSGDVVETDS